jgi:hypothetical protein
MAPDELEDDDEVEITDEMIEAGVAAYLAADSRVGDSESVVMAIYRAMTLRDRGLSKSYSP